MTIYTLFLIYIFRTSSSNDISLSTIRGQIKKYEDMLAKLLRIGEDLSSQGDSIATLASLSEVLGGPFLDGIFIYISNALDFIRSKVYL